MDQLNSVVRVIKLAMVCAALWLAYRQTQAIRKTFKHVILGRIFVLSSYLVALVQIPMLSVGILFDYALSTNLDYIHQEKHFNDLNIYVHTSDHGAVGSAYHHIYLKCTLPFDRYELTHIKTVNWIRDYELEIRNNKLLIGNNEGVAIPVDIGCLSTGIFSD
jgi:hypothetical protein